MRGLSPAFMTKLKKGFLQPLLNLVKNDHTLCLGIRKDYVNVYYRGGNALRIGKRGSLYRTFFDRNFLDEHSTRVPVLPNLLEGEDDVKKWIDAIPFLKHEMDLWFGRHPKNEREFQQLVLRENNFENSAKGTDYFICDIEYTSRKTKGRFDLIAVHWPSSGTERKNNKNLGLAFMEKKYRDTALAGKAGLRKHIEDVNGLLGDQKNLTDIKEEMIIVFNQKLELGLIDNQKPIGSFSHRKPEYIIVLVNHDPASSKLRAVLKTLPSCPNMDLKFAASSFMGYGLYDQSIYPLDEFLARFRDQI